MDQPFLFCFALVKQLIGGIPVFCKNNHAKSSKTKLREKIYTRYTVLFMDQITSVVQFYKGGIVSSVHFIKDLWDACNKAKALVDPGEQGCKCSGRQEFRCRGVAP